jgi:hypothetical protein
MWRQRIMIFELQWCELSVVCKRVLIDACAERTSCACSLHPRLRRRRKWEELARFVLSTEAAPGEREAVEDILRNAPAFMALLRAREL